MDQLSDTYFYVTNIRGDVEAIVDEDGNEVASYSYDPWGVPTITGTPSLPNPFLYQGAYGNIWDEEIELYWMNARHYDPSISRFITQDRSHGTLTNTMSQNLYIYCYNSPYMFKDPSGFSATSSFMSYFYNYIVDPTTSTPDGCGVNLTDEEQAMYDIARKDDPELTVIDFLRIWNEADRVSKDMRKYREGSNGEDYNKYDFEFAFWTCYWNDKAKLGLSEDQMVDLANHVKAIAYQESRIGYASGNTKDGLMQVEKDDENLAFDKMVKRGWFSADVVGNRDYKSDDYDVNGDLLTAIGTFLGHIAAKHGNLTKEENKEYGYSEKFSAFLHNHDRGSVIMDNLRSGTAAYGGGNAHDAAWFWNHGYKHLCENDRTMKEGVSWEHINTPYANAVVSLATTGKYKDARDDHVIDLTIP